MMVYEKRLLNKIEIQSLKFQALRDTSIQTFQAETEQFMRLSVWNIKNPKLN